MGKKIVNWSAAGSSVLSAVFCSVSFGSAISVIGLLATVPLGGVGGGSCLVSSGVIVASRKLETKRKNIKRSRHLSSPNATWSTSCYPKLSIITLFLHLSLISFFPSLSSTTSWKYTGSTSHAASPTVEQKACRCWKTRERDSRQSCSRNDKKNNWPPCIKLIFCQQDFPCSEDTIIFCTTCVENLTTNDI